MMGDLGGLLAISEISLSSSQLHSGTCWATYCHHLLLGILTRLGGGGAVTWKNLGEQRSCFSVLSDPWGQALSFLLIL